MVQIGVPISASFTAYGDASVNTIPTETFTWGAANKDITYSGMTAAEFNDAFDLSENVFNDVASLSVYMTADENKKNAFIAKLKLALETGAGDLAGWLAGEARAELDEHLKANGIPDAIEAELVTTISMVDFAEDASQGAVNMWNALEDANGSGPLNLISRQIPRSRYGTDAFDGKMHAAEGDEVVFRFNIEQMYSFSPAEAGGIGGTGVELADLGGGIYPAKTAVTYGINSRSVNVTLTLA